MHRHICKQQVFLSFRSSIVLLIRHLSVKRNLGSMPFTINEMDNYFALEYKEIL